jgi:hypothetical protein
LSAGATRPVDADRRIAARREEDRRRGHGSHDQPRGPFSRSRRRRRRRPGAGSDCGAGPLSAHANMPTRRTGARRGCGGRWPRPRRAAPAPRHARGRRRCCSGGRSTSSAGRAAADTSATELHSALCRRRSRLIDGVHRPIVARRGLDAAPVRARSDLAGRRSSRSAPSHLNRSRPTGHRVTGLRAAARVPGRVASAGRYPPPW